MEYRYPSSQIRAMSYLSNYPIRRYEVHTNETKEHDHLVDLHLFSRTAASRQLRALL